MHKYKNIDQFINEGSSSASYNSPIGMIKLVGDDSSLKAVFFEEEAGEKAYEIKQAGSGMILKQAGKFLDIYFSPRPKIEIKKIRPAENGYLHCSFLCGNEGLDIELVFDLQYFTSNEIRVYAALLKVPSGKTVSYNGLSKKAGFPGGSRFIGNTMAKNPFPIFIPCHRVIKSDGSIGNYTGGVEIKRKLLELEAAAIPIQ